MDRRRVVRVSGMSYGESILSIENVGCVLWVLNEFHLLWIESDYEFYSGFHNEMHKYFVYSFRFMLQSCPVMFKLSFFFLFFFYKQGKKQVMQSCIFVCSSSCRTVNILNTGLLFLNR